MVDQSTRDQTISTQRDDATARPATPEALPVPSDSRWISRIGHLMRGRSRPAAIAIRLIIAPIAVIAQVVAAYLFLGIIIAVIGTISGWIPFKAFTTVGLISFALLTTLMLFLTVTIMVRPANKAKGRAGTIELASFEYSLKALLNCYRDVLKCVDQLPAFGRWPTTTETMSLEENDTRWLRPFWGGSNSSEPTRRKLTIRPFVRLFVETHIRRQLLAINRRLQYEGLVIDESEANKRITAMRSSLDESVNRLFGWGRVRRTASKVPWLPLALGGSTALVAIFGGANESGKDFLTKSTIAMMRQHQWQALFLQATIMLFWIFVCLYCLYLIIVPAVATGFNVKKALFSGGRLSSPENNLFNKPPYYYVKWQDFPERNIYRVEQDVFAALGARKEPGFQVDLVFPCYPI